MILTPRLIEAAEVCGSTIAKFCDIIGVEPTRTQMLVMIKDFGEGLAGDATVEELTDRWLAMFGVAR